MANDGRAAANLRQHQRQLDDDGVMVGVSRQAVCEVLAELAAAREALKPFADLRVTRFMTDGLRYNFRVDAAWIRKARTACGMED